MTRTLLVLVAAFGCLAADAGCVKGYYRKNSGCSDGGGANVQAHILSVLRENPRLTAHAVSEKIGMALRTDERTLADLKKFGALVRQGGTRGYWEIAGNDVGQR